MGWTCHESKLLSEKHFGGQPWRQRLLLPDVIFHPMCVLAWGALRLHSLEGTGAFLLPVSFLNYLSKIHTPETLTWRLTRQR
jgi:hypothetical protein